MSRRSTAIVEPRAVSADFTVETWPIERVTPYARNARNLTEAAITKVAASLKEFGWQQPIVVDAEGVIVAGHTRHAAARRLGMTEVPVRIASNLTLAQIKAYRLADNRTAQETTWDLDMLAVEIQDLQGLDIDLRTIAFDRDELTDLLFKDWPEGEKPKKKGSKAGGLEFRVVVDCEGEQHQTELLERFKMEGLACRALIS